MENATNAINTAAEKYNELFLRAKCDFDMKNRQNIWNEKAGMSVMYETEIFAKIGLRPSMSTKTAELTFEK